VGCTGEAQVIITNQELVELMVEILQAIDSPASLRTLRSLALTKLPVYDAVITSIEGGWHDTFASAEASPEQIALRTEQEHLARRAASDFLDRLHRLTCSHRQRTERFWRVLWHCYFDPAEPSQLLIAEMVGISDSSVSDYRRKIEGELAKLAFTPEQLRSFAEELDEQLRLRLAALDVAQPEADLDLTSPWPQYHYGPLPALEGAPAA
jgi:hypothetical protein